jgi:HSP20 family protein
MRPVIHSVVLPSQLAEFTEEIRQFLSELGRVGEPLSGECSPPIDVHETENALVITVDLPGVDSQFIRIVAKGATLLIAGEKAVRRGRGESSFHLVERGYGRFARTVHLTVPCNTAEAHAELAHGELRVTLPKLSERRGRRIPIAVRSMSA